jgi:hypothetical protein
MVTIKNCEQVMSKEVTIGSGIAKDGQSKHFTFNAWVNDYSVWHDGGVIDSGNAIEELLEEYNEL